MADAPDIVAKNKKIAEKTAETIAAITNRPGTLWAPLASFPLGEIMKWWLTLTLCLVACV